LEAVLPARHRNGTGDGGELKAILAPFDQFLPALPPEPHAYFNELRGVIVAAIEWTDVWWALDESGEPVPPARG
jgi:hypothetical protein